MSPLVIFALALRCIGVWQVVEGIGLAVTWFDVHEGYASGASYLAMAYVNQSVIHFLMGFVLILGAPVIARWCYPSHVRDKRVAEEPQPQSE
jgi:predicted cation transporter